jgi:hypothetical protein
LLGGREGRFGRTLEKVISVLGSLRNRRWV